MHMIPALGGECDTFALKCRARRRVVGSIVPNGLRRPRRSLRRTNYALTIVSITGMRCARHEKRDERPW